MTAGAPSIENADVAETGKTARFPSHRRFFRKSGMIYRVRNLDAFDVITIVITVLLGVLLRDPGVYTAFIPIILFCSFFSRSLNLIIGLSLDTEKRIVSVTSAYGLLREQYSFLMIAGILIRRAPHSPYGLARVSLLMRNDGNDEDRQVWVATCGLSEIVALVDETNSIVGRELPVTSILSRK